MPGTRCTVAVCNNSYAKTKKAGMNIIYHQFPKTQPLRDLWIKSCRRAGKWNPSTCHVCSLHFTDDDYKKDVVSEYLVCSSKRRLKATAVPSLFLTKPPPLEIATKRKKMINDNCDEELECYKTVKSTNTHESSNNIQILEINGIEDLNKDMESKSDNIDVLNNFEENKNKYSSSIPTYIIVQDCSTQTDTDFFLQNYKLLMKKNEGLTNEVLQWKNKYNELMLNVKYLEAEVQKLTLNSKQSYLPLIDDQKSEKDSFS